MPVDYNVRCPDCHKKAQYFSVWRAVTFFCTNCNQAKLVPLKALGRVGRQIQRAVDNGQLDLTVPKILELKKQEIEGDV